MNKSKEIQKQLSMFGVHLRRARVARKMTLEVLAEKANLNIRTLQRIEAGEINILITTAMRLQQGLGCSWRELLPAAPQPREGSGSC